MSATDKARKPEAVAVCCGAPEKTDNQPPKDGHCPRCDGDTDSGYGLAGGGMGTYWFCLSDDCDYFYKEQDADGDR